MDDPDGQAATVGERIRAVRARIGAAEARAGRSPEERVVSALDAGERIFGENYVQPAVARWPALRERYAGVELHMIGPVQTNKAKDVVLTFDVVQTLDRDKLARALAREMDRRGRRLPCFVQVNTGEEPQKAGVLPTDADRFIRSCREDYGLDVNGCMAIPPEDEEPSPHFALLAKIARRNGLDCTSMGMSADFETAIRFGATHVRVGSALFGPRPPRR
jgi:pyridoxal phosphate enzyme (YggS family)